MEKHNKKIIGFNIIEVIIIIVISGITSAIATGIVTTSNNRTESGVAYSELLQDDKIRTFLDVYGDVVNGYYENVDKDKAIDSAISGLMDYLGDKYTKYLDGDATDNLNSSLAGTYKGIGVSIADKSIIKDVFEDSPAEKAGLQAEDQIIKIDKTDIRDLSTDEVVKIIQNSNGEIKLIILRNNEEKEIKVRVSDVNKPAVASQVIDKNNKKIGYLFIETFTTTIDKQVKNALTKLENENIDSLIIDVRGNIGGYLNKATNISNLFLEKGKIIYSLENKDKIDAIYDDTDEKRNYKIVVLVNEGTASAAEVLTASLKDSYGATIVGQTTYGKGKVQQTKNLTDGTMVKYTTARWLRPNGECVDGQGITPDYIVDLEKDENGDFIDKQIEKAIEVALN